MPNQLTNQCCLCNKTFDQQNHPRIMPSCDHSVCINCLKNAIKNQNKIITCKFCGNQQEIIQTDLEYFPKNISLIRMFKDSGIKKNLNGSQVSTSNKVSQSRSSNMPSLYSPEGLQFSESSDLLKNDSSLISRKSSSISTQNQSNKLCTIHQKELEIICLSDFTRLCALCAVFGTHKDHTLKTVDETLKMLAVTTDEFDKIKQKKKLLESRIKNSEFKSQIVEKITGAKNKLSKQIKDQFTVIKQAVAQAEKNANDDLNKRFKQVHDKINKLAKEESDFEGLFSNWARSIELELAETSRVDLSFEQKMQIYWQNIMNSAKQGSFYLSQIQLYTQQKKKRLESVPGLVTVNIGQNLVKDIYNHVSFKFDDSSVDKVFHQILLTTSRAAQQNALRLEMEGKISINIKQSSIMNNNVTYSNLHKNTPFSNTKINSVPTLPQHQPQTILPRKPIQVEFSSPQNFLSPAKQKMLSPPSSSQVSNMRKSPRQKSKSLPKPPHPNSSNNLQKNFVSPAKKQPGSTVSNFQSIIDNKKLQTTVEGIVDMFVSDDKLDTLDLCSFDMPDNQVLATLNYVLGKKKIKCLKLSHNKLTNQGFSQIIPFLRFTTNINLSHNSLTEQVLNTLIKQRQKLQSLRILNLAHNKVNERKAKVYVEELKRQGIIVTL